MHSVDYGQDYEDLSNNLAAVGEVNSIAVAPFNPMEIYAATDLGVVWTVDGGQTWWQFQTGLPRVRCTELRYLKSATTTTDTLVVSTEGRGVWQRPITSTPVVYLDRRLAGAQDGTHENPYVSFATTLPLVPPGGVLALHGDNYTGAPVTITTPMTLQAYESPATIGG
jgi:hypothetical protein